MAAADSEGTTRQLFPGESGLVNALARRVVKVSCGISVCYPAGYRSEDFMGYHRAVRRWVRLRDELRTCLMGRGVL